MLNLVKSICTVLLLVGFYGCDSVAPPLEQATKSTLTPPNVVVIIADDLGWNDVGAYGSSFAQTPNIDRLAENGLRYDNAFLTTSSCSASRGSIMTGRYPHSNGLPHLHQPLPASETTLAVPLREAGYYTAAIGKWHLGGNPVADFDRVIEDHEGAGTRHWIPQLQARPKDKPFFFWLASLDPHRPYDGNDGTIADPYDPDTIVPPQGFINDDATRRELHPYFREVSRFDRDVGRVIAELEKQQVLDNTLVIIMSDNGRPFHLSKLTLYDSGIKTPFILYWPQHIKNGAVREQLISMVDLAPTILQLANAPALEKAQGWSFAATLDDPTVVVREYAFAERNWHGMNAHERAVRTLDYFYKENQFPYHGNCIASGFDYTASHKALKASLKTLSEDNPDKACFDQKREQVELMKVSKDGQRSVNISKDPAYADVKTHLQNVLTQWRKSTGDFDYTPYTPSK